MRSLLSKKKSAAKPFEKINGAEIFVSVAEIARQYPFRPNNNLQDKLWWYEYNPSSYEKTSIRRSNLNRTTFSDVE